MRAPKACWAEQRTQNTHTRTRIFLRNPSRVVREESLYGSVPWICGFQYKNLWQGRRYFHAGVLLRRFITTRSACFFNTTQQQQGNQGRGGAHGGRTLTERPPIRRRIRRFAPLTEQHRAAPTAAEAFRLRSMCGTSASGRAADVYVQR